MRNLRNFMVALAGTALLGASTVHAHTPVSPGDANTLVAGIWHPLLGWDHLLAAVAVGLWADWQRGWSLWTLPLVFLALITVGSVLAHSGLALPDISTSLLLLGLLLAFAARLPWIASITMLASFAIFHGHAHGVGMHQEAHAMLFGPGLVASTAVLVGLGVGLGRMSHAGRGANWLRFTGGAIAAAGAFSTV